MSGERATARTSCATDRQVLRRVVLGAVLVLLAVLTSSCGGEDPAGAASQQEPPAQAPSAVVVIPGYGGSPDSVAQLAAALRAAGHTVTVVTLPGDGTGDIAAMVPAVSTSTERLTAAGLPVDVVGYSMGGLLARAWADSGGAAVARRIVLVGTPNHGTDAASLGQLAGACPAACQQMVPGSSFLQQLNRGDPTPDGPAWITVRSADDEVVRPDDTVVLDGASNVLLQDICAGAAVSHSGLVTQPLPLAVISRAVAPQPWVSPGPDACPPGTSG
jgi:pimeloyl-ACP methyl ester carboxylesterase